MLILFVWASMIIIALFAQLSKKKYEGYASGTSSAVKLSFVSVPSNAPLEQLPKEMLETIFSFLDASAISNCMGVSRYWHHFISSKRLKEAIIERTLSSLKTTALQLELAIGQEVEEKCLVHREYPSHYPRKWLIEDGERWRIYEFKDHATFSLMRDAFVADARLALRIRVRAFFGSNTRWIFDIEDGWQGAGSGQISISKSPNHPQYAHYPLEGIFQVGRTYDLITNGSFMSAGQNQVPVVHQVRPVDAPKMVSLPRCAHAVIQSVGFAACSIVFTFLIMQLQEMIRFQYLWSSYVSPLDCQAYAESTFDRWSLVSVGTYLGYVQQRQQLMLPHKRIPKRTEDYLTIWMPVFSVIISVLGLVVPVYGKWLVNVMFILKVPINLDMAQFHSCMKLIKPRFLFWLGSVSGVLLFILSAPWYTLFAHFNLKAYLIHVCFTFFTFGIARVGYVRCYKRGSPNVYARSRGLKKWINWSLPVKWWFFVMLVGMPLWNTKTHCVGLV